MERFDPESTDLAALVTHLRQAIGSSLPGSVVGRTEIRDEVARYLQCSQLEAERLVDTMVGRGFLVLHREQDGLEYWTMPST